MAPQNCTNLLPLNGDVVEDDYYSISCSMYYSGYVGPNMTWSGPGVFTTQISQTPDFTWSGVGFTVKRLMEGKSFSLLTNFTEKGFQAPAYDPNPPTFSVTYTSVALHVRCE